MQRRWGEAAKAITDAVDTFAANGVDQRLAGDVRAIRRDVTRVSRHLTELGREVGL